MCAFSSIGCLQTLKLYLPQPGSPSGGLLCNRKWTECVCVCVLFFVLGKRRVIMCSNLRLWRLVEKDKATHRPFRPPLTAFCFLSITVSSVTSGCSDLAHTLQSAVCQLALRNTAREGAEKHEKSFLESSLERSISLVLLRTFETEVRRTQT